MSRPTTELAHLFRQLKAPAAAGALPKLADRARAEEWSYEQFAAVLLKTETDSRDSHGVRLSRKGSRSSDRRRGAEGAGLRTAGLMIRARASRRRERGGRA